MVLEPGEIIHVVERRAFEADVRRHFAGRVDVVHDAAMRATGYVYAFHAGRRLYERRSPERTRVFSLVDARLVINVIPDTVDPGALVYKWSTNESLMIHEGLWTMELTEFSWGSL